MWRHRWYLESTRKGMGSWFGHRMQAPITAFDPYVIISTYPLGSAGLSWLRSTRRLSMPVGAWIPAFCPHPSWLYRSLDITYVMHACSLRSRSRPSQACGSRSGRCRSGTHSPQRSRRPPGNGWASAPRGSSRRCVATLAFGRLDRAVTAVLAAGPDVQAVVVCGCNEGLRRELTARGEPPDRPRVLGWTDDMPSWMTAADIVIGMQAVLPGWRQWPAAVPWSCSTRSPGSAGPTPNLWRRPGRRGRPATGGRPGRAHRAGRRVSMPSFPVRAEDAVFLHAQTLTCPQHVGAVVMLNGPGVDLAA